MNAHLALQILTFCITLCILILLIWGRVKAQKTKSPILIKQPHASHEDGKCSKDACGAIDPVNEPSYNMKNVVKQRVLLEEHLAEKNKYCVSCIVKHFLHIIGLVEEAVWLAGEDLYKYPMLSSSAEFYQTMFDMWNAGKHDDATIRQVLGSVREHRRALIEAYFLA